MKKILVLLTMCFCAVCIASAKKVAFPKVDQKGNIAIVAHRGYWNCEAAGFCENSIASLKAAQNLGLWGSECDIHLTSDGEIIVNHNPDIEGHKISECTFDFLSQFKLPNGERRPTFDEYLDQTAKAPATMLIIELKKQPTKDMEARLVRTTVKKLKAHKLYRPDRVLFISFSPFMCELIAKKCPKFINQFLTSDKKKDMSPAQWAQKGINGIDYQYPLFQMHNDWVKAARDLGMSVNSWTVNETSDINDMISLGVDAITTNEPERVRALLGEKEYKN